MFYCGFEKVNLLESVIKIIQYYLYTLKGGLLLALLDYVNRAREIEICLSSVLRPSVVSRPFFRVAIISDSNARISSNFGCCFPLDQTLGLFFRIFEKKNVFFYEYFSFMFTSDPM